MVFFFYLWYNIKNSVLCQTATSTVRTVINPQRVDSWKRSLTTSRRKQSTHIAVTTVKKHHQLSTPANARCGFLWYNTPMQTKSDLELWYQIPDQWGYFNNPEDKKRRQKLLEALKPYGKFNKALDIGAGEGYITRVLPAEKIFFQELSDLASSRQPQEFERVTFQTDKVFDLVVATGVFYKQYDWEEMQNFALRTLKKGGILATVHIESWEVPIDESELVLIHQEKYPYREFIHNLKIYRKI